jgi:hypothetical protein
MVIVAYINWRYPRISISPGISILRKKEDKKFIQETRDIHQCTSEATLCILNKGLIREMVIFQINFQETFRLRRCRHAALEVQIIRKEHGYVSVCRLYSHSAYLLGDIMNSPQCIIHSLTVWD